MVNSQTTKPLTSRASANSARRHLPSRALGAGRGRLRRSPVLRLLCLLAAVPAACQVPWIDTHTHPLGGPRLRADVFAPERLDAVLSVGERWGVTRALLAMPPAPWERPQIERQIISAAKSRPERLGFLGGGLQALIAEAVRRGGVPEELRARFEKKVADLARGGAAGFGEMTALHFSFVEGHPYIEAPPDHPLFLLLADLAARHDLPIDLHMEAVVKETPTPPRLLALSPLNPPKVRGNLEAFERLLSHNHKARIVWLHIGWDNTGNITPARLRRLLEGHANLFLQIRIPARPGLFPENGLLAPDSTIRPEWLDLIRSWPERAVLGSDAFLARPDFEEGLRRTALFLRALPPELARTVGLENAKRIYRIR